MIRGVRTELGAFEALFGGLPEVVSNAPGRVNLLGEHTDYNGGYVLPMAIPQRTGVEMAARPGTLVELVSESVSPPRVSYDLGHESTADGWVDYVQGLTWALREEGFTVPAFVARVTSTVPLGGGLSSSASLLVAFARSLRDLAELPLDDVALARVAWRAEHDFVGAPVGIMDPMAVSLADDHTALFLDTRSMRYERVALPRGAELLVLDSGVAHDNVRGDYRTRRRECERAAEALGVRLLRDAPSDWEQRVAALPSPLDRRARHVITENTRVVAAVAAMRAGDVKRLGALLDEGHRSMRDDFEASAPAVDALVEAAKRHPDVLGARITGGGFGGAVVALVREGSSSRVGVAMVREADRDGRRGVHVLVPGGNV